MNKRDKHLAGRASHLPLHATAFRTKTARAGKKWVAEYDYDAADSDEVSFKKGDTLIDVESVGVGWVHANVEESMDRGMDPSNYIKEKLFYCNHDASRMGDFP
jgi:hypothetical protein